MQGAPGGPRDCNKLSGWPTGLQLAGEIGRQRCFALSTLAFRRRATQAAQAGAAAALADGRAPVSPLITTRRAILTAAVGGGLPLPLRVCWHRRTLRRASEPGSSVPGQWQPGRQQPKLFTCRRFQPPARLPDAACCCLRPPAMALAHALRRSKRGSVPVASMFLRIPGGVAWAAGRRWFSDGPAAPARPAIDKLLVANRGEIACRVLTTGKQWAVMSTAHDSPARGLRFSCAAESGRSSLVSSHTCSQAPGHPHRGGVQRSRPSLAGGPATGACGMHNPIPAVCCFWGRCIRL